MLHININLRHDLSIATVARFYFTAKGYFQNVSSSTSNLAVYFFHFEDRIPCSSAEGLIGMSSVEINQTPFVEQLSKMKDSFLHWQKVTQDKHFWRAAV